MSHALNLAVALPGGPVAIGAAAAGALALIIVILLIVRKRRARSRTSEAWTNAAEELGIDLDANGSEVGPVARGRVNDHVVSVSSVKAGKGRKARKSTQYSVKFEATEAPQFRLIKRNGHDMPTVDSGNPKFDAVVVVQTEQPTLLAQFLTPGRRAAILRMLTYWPEALISNRDVHLTTDGIENDHDSIVDAVCHLVATAETFDRITRQPAAPVEEPAAVEENPDYQPHPPAPTAAAAATEAPVVEPVTADAPVEETLVEAPTTDAPIEDAPAAETPAVEAPVEAAVPAATPAAEVDVLTEVRLDEVTVLNELFNGGLQPDESAARFQQVYQGREVSWTGEVVRVGPPDEHGRQRIAALIGSADGQSPESGRVVALTTVPAEPVVAQGDVVAFSGALVNLDAAQRLFHVA